MLRKLMDANPKTFDDDFCVVFANTGREHEATLDFGHEVETRWGVPIVWLEYCRENGAHSQKVVCYETAARRSAPGPFDAWLAITKTLPNVRARGCSSEEDAKAEGCAASISKTIRGWTPQVFEFSLLWDSIHGKQPGRRFDNAPWVWVYEFQRIK